MCDDFKIILAYLPPYSPDLNPIEEAFAELKAWLCKNRALLNKMPTFEAYLRLGIENLPDNARGHFARAQIGCPLRGGEDADYWDD